MSRLRYIVLCVLTAGVASAILSAGQPTEPAPTSTESPVLTRFLSAETIPLTSYRAVRRLHATARGEKMRAAMTVMTTLDPFDGFDFVILESSGSDFIRNRVFLPALEAERDAAVSGAAARGALTPANYEFAEKGVGDEGLVQIGIRPRRKDALLVDGSILVTHDADLVRIQGLLVKRPSFWARRVEIVRKYGRVGGVRVPVTMESTAEILMAGRSTFEMKYDYESINGQRVP